MWAPAPNHPFFAEQDALRRVHLAHVLLYLHYILYNELSCTTAVGAIGRYERGWHRLERSDRTLPTGRGPYAEHAGYLNAWRVRLRTVTIGPPSFKSDTKQLHNGTNRKKEAMSQFRKECCLMLFVLFCRLVSFDILQIHIPKTVAMGPLVMSNITSQDPACPEKDPTFR